MCCLWTYVVCSWRNWVHWPYIVIDIEQVALAGPAAGGGVRSSETLRYYWPSGAGAAMVTSSVSSHCQEGDAWENCLYTKGILYAKVCTRLNHLGAKIEKSPYRGRGANPPPTPSPRSVATLPRKVTIFLGIFYLKCWEVWMIEL